jgi:hypothetical protein
MFVRWQSRKRQRPIFGRAHKHVWERGQYSHTVFSDVEPPRWQQDVAWYAILVEAVRSDGQPRQRHVAYLGSITESALSIVAQRHYFWEEASKRLDALGNRVRREDRGKIEAALAARVPRPTKRR